MRKLLKKIKLNKKSIFYLCIKITGVIFSVIASIAIFIDVSSLDISIGYKVLILFSIPTISFLVSVPIVLFRRQRKLHSINENDIFVEYADIFEVANKSEKKCVVIPVNDTFETVIEEPSIPKPLVSKNTLHGKWIHHMKNKGFDLQKIDFLIENYLIKTKTKPTNIYTKKQKAKGKLKSYEYGTVSIIETDTAYFYLVVNSKFDEDNKASSSINTTRDVLNELIVFYNKSGQNYPLYIPLIGTGMSSSGLSMEQSFTLIKDVLSINDNEIRGDVHIVIYEGDRDKISILK